MMARLPSTQCWRARQAGLDVIAITDHDEIRGALKALDLAPQYGIEVIPGIEITTAEGDLVALFVTETIEPGRPLIETIIKAQKRRQFLLNSK